MIIFTELFSFDDQFSDEFGIIFSSPISELETIDVNTLVVCREHKLGVSMFALEPLFGWCREELKVLLSSNSISVLNIQIP